MAYRLTDTNKWSDVWYSNLRPIEKLLFIYLCDNCDCAGFIEVNIRKWANEIGNNHKDVEGALKGLSKALIYSNDSECLYLRTYLKHQKHFPLNEKDNAYKGILSRFENYSYKFGIVEINEFIQGALEGLIRGNDNDKDNDKINSLNKEDIKLGTWKTDFSIYKESLKNAYIEIVTPEYIAERQVFHPNLDIINTVRKACKDFWNTEAGWKNKKTAKTVEIDWKATFNNCLTFKVNQVWLPKEILNKGENPTGWKYPSKDKPILRTERI
jgi:hypothetical protein